MNLILAQIYSNFKELASLELQELNLHRIKMLEQAFEILSSVPKHGIVETPYRDSIFLFEMIAKVLVKGTSVYWSNTKNQFDAFIAVTTWFLDVYAYIPNALDDQTRAKLLLTARCLRVLA
ncbi:hypothetical protein THRCLA_20612 [Thraustotheca clavata]|uniref:Uncharacterized protein n=1 Tax=Thraustotheca clavata TaxID=74557 RepID=A0A1W0A5H2_9STRA|nr:hypothetical protein THRCLA_20612 [Thraustotheca clavata]